MGKTENIYIRRAKRKRFIKRFIVIMIIAIIAFSFFLWKTNIFNLNNIIVTGDTLITKDYIIDEMNNFKGENIVFLKKEDIIKKIKFNPYVKSLQIERKLPNSMVLEVEESKGLYYIYDGDDFNIISSDLIILEKTYEVHEEKLIEIRGKGITGKVVGDKIDESYRTTNILEEVYKEYEVIKSKNESFNITALEIEDLSSIKVYFGDIKVLIGSDENFRKKMSDAINIYKTGLVNEYINVSFDGTPDFK